MANQKKVCMKISNLNCQQDFWQVKIQSKFSTPEYFIFKNYYERNSGCLECAAGFSQLLSQSQVCLQNREFLQEIAASSFTAYPQNCEVLDILGKCVRCKDNFILETTSSVCVLKEGSLANCS